MEILLIILLILLNGVFAMSEISILSSRKNKLQQMASKGQRGAQTALDLLSNPSEFLSSVQVGITLISILLGAIAEPTVGKSIEPFIHQIPVIGAYAHQITFLIVITAITYLSLIIGELVPKRIAMSHPEQLAVFLAPFMRAVALGTEPFVKILSRSTEAIFKLLRLRPADSAVTEEEVRMLIREGARLGVFNKTERDLVERALRLDDVRVSTLMKPRNEIECIDEGKFAKKPLAHISKYKYENLILCEKSIDNVTGIIYVKDFLKDYAATGKFNIKGHVQKPLLVPESTRVLRVLEIFRNSPMHIALVIDEYGNIQGLVTFNDILRALVGDIESREKTDDPEVVKRTDGSLLLDGMLSISELKEILKVTSLPGDDSGAYQTLGGFVLSYLDRVPKSGDKFRWDGFQFEVVDMDQHRVDKVIVTPVKKK